MCFVAVVDKNQDILEKSVDSDFQFYQDYKKFALMYQELLDKGVVSKRQSQLLSITDKAKIASIHFSQPFHQAYFPERQLLHGLWALNLSNRQQKQRRVTLFHSTHS